MTRSTVQPQAIKLWRMLGGELDITAAWDVHQITVTDEMNGDHQEWEYESIRFSVPYEGQNPTEWLSRNEKKILLIAKGRAGKASDEEKALLDTSNGYYANITQMDAGRTDKKFIKVKKTFGGKELQAWCYVTYSVLLAYQKGELAIGDYVIVDFVDGDLDKPIVIDKVVGF